MDYRMLTFFNDFERPPAWRIFQGHACNRIRRTTLNISEMIRQRRVMTIRTT